MKKVLYAAFAVIALASCKSGDPKQEALDKQLKEFQTNWEGVDEKLEAGNTDFVTAAKSITDVISAVDTMKGRNKEADSLIALFADLKSEMAGISASIDSAKNAYQTDNNAFTEWKTRYEKGEIKDVNTAESEFNAFGGKIKEYEDRFKGWTTAMNEISGKSTTWSMQIMTYLESPVTVKK